MGCQFEMNLLPKASVQPCATCSMRLDLIPFFHNATCSELSPAAAAFSERGWKNSELSPEEEADERKVRARENKPCSEPRLWHLEIFK